MGILDDIIKQMNDERSLRNSPFPEAELTARKLGLYEADTDSEVTRIANYWANKAHTMTDGELKKVIGDDLESLEYSPDEIAKLVPKIMRLARK